MLAKNHFATYEREKKKIKRRNIILTREISPPPPPPTLCPGDIRECIRVKRNWKIFRRIKKKKKMSSRLLSYVLSLYSRDGKIRNLELGMGKEKKSSPSTDNFTFQRGLHISGLGGIIETPIVDFDRQIIDELLFSTKRKNFREKKY